jgi:hypothetical protein
VVPQDLIASDTEETLFANTQATSVQRSRSGTQTFVAFTEEGITAASTGAVTNSRSETRHVAKRMAEEKNSHNRRAQTVLLVVLLVR